jgi:hypothetical protein
MSAIFSKAMIFEDAIYIRIFDSNSVLREIVIKITGSHISRKRNALLDRKTVLMNTKYGISVDYDNLDNLPFGCSFTGERVETEKTADFIILS